MGETDDGGCRAGDKARVRSGRTETTDQGGSEGAEGTESYHVGNPRYGRNE